MHFGKKNNNKINIHILSEKVHLCFLSSSFTVKFSALLMGSREVTRYRARHIDLGPVNVRSDEEGSGFLKVTDSDLIAS